MELENRLIKLAADVAVERQAEFIKEWPKKIKMEAVYLSGLLTPDRVSEATKLHKGTLQVWIRKFCNEEDVISDFEEENIKVTRIVSGQIESQVKEQLPVASIVKDKLEFKVYCKDLAEKLAERFCI